MKVKNFPKLTKITGLQAIVVILYFVCGCFSVVQNDTWWHLSAGQYMYSQGRILLEDVSTYTIPHGAVWLNHEWLSQIILYVIYHFGGLASLGILYGIIVASYALIIISFSPRNSNSCRALICALPFLMLELSVRPQPFTFLIMLIGLACLSSLRLWFLPIIIVAGANLHGGVLLLGIPIVILSALNLRYRVFSITLLLCVSLACLLATFATPLGLGLYKVVFDFMTLPTFIVLYELAPGYKMPLVVLGIAISLVVLARRFWKSERGFKEQFLLWCAFVFAVLALKSVRNVPLYGLIWAFALPNQETCADSGSDEESPTIENTLVVVGTAMLSFIAIAICYLIPIARLGWHPLSEVAIKSIHACEEPVFNSYDVGGYLQWFIPERKIFIDSRYHPFDQNFVKETLRAQNGEFKELFEKFHFKCAVFEPNLALEPALLASGWKESFGDETVRVLTAP